MVFAQSSHAVILDEAFRLRLKFLGMYYARVDQGWDSRGRLESDCAHHIMFVMSGFGRVRHQQQSMELVPGFAYWCPANHPVARECPEQMELYYIRFRCEWFEGIDALLNWPSRQHLCLGPWDMPTLTREWSEPKLSLNALLRLQGFIRLWMAEHFPNLDDFLAHHQSAYVRFGEILQKLEDSCNASIQIEDLAKLHGSSLSAFSRAFTRSLGLSPKAYLNLKINESACHLLLNSHEPLKIISEKLHFADEFYFNRFFTKMNGIPPAGYRRRMQNLEEPK